MSNYLDMTFLLFTSLMCIFVAYKMFFGREVRYVCGGLALLNIGFWSAVKFIDRYKGDLGNFVDFQQDLSLFIALVCIILYIKALKT